MPNWTENRLSFTRKEDYEKIRSEICNDNGFDFNNLIPMPKLLMNTHSGSLEYRLKDFIDNKYNGSDEPIKIMAAFREHESNIDDETAQELTNNLICYRTYGVATWYEWANANWNTKWNACHTLYNDEDLLIMFDTAWSSPWPIFRALAVRYPTMTINIKCIDEDIGPNYGVTEAQIHDGVVTLLKEYGSIELYGEKEVEEEKE